MGRDGWKEGRKTAATIAGNLAEGKLDLDMIMAQTTLPFFTILFAKGDRLRLPAAFCMSKSTLVLTAGLRGHLLLFRQNEWTPIVYGLLNEDLRSNSTDEQHRAVALRRLILGCAVSLKISSRGTIRLPEHLIGYANINGRVVWHPTSTGIELWDPDHFDASRHLNLFDPVKI